MCGIVGICHFDPEVRLDERLLDRMTDVLSHRGPDGRGTHRDGTFGLGHRRLAIIDLSADAAQPLANEDGTIWAALNGEIYNFRELRHELVGKGHVFRSHGDTEVLVHLYEELGEGLVERLRGMFALAVWDGRRRRLLLARDRFGQKPLYYRLTDKQLHFGSEIKAILQDPAVPREPEPLALHAYLTYGYVPAPATAFRGIAKLPPGHLLLCDADGRHQLRRYWRLRQGPKDPAAAGGAARRRAARRVLELLDEATRLRMISDVPLGALLSGGLDSSAVVASMCAAGAAGGGAVRTFTIGFDESGYDESGYAAEVARHLETEHHRLRLRPEALTELERLAWHYGEPFADSSILPTFAVSALAREQVTVALTGDGGDELFCGYRRYLSVALEERIRSAPALVRAAARSRVLARLLRRARRKALAGDLSRSRRFRRLAITDLYLSRLEALSDELERSLLSEDLRRRLGGSAPREIVLGAIRDSDGQCLAERCAHADSATYLPDDILVKVDVASMAHGLECRAPLLDHVLAEYVAALPFDFKMPRLRRKALLKAAVADRLPRSVLLRRKKGFSIPLKSWLHGDFEPLLSDTLLSRRASERGYFEHSRIARLIDEHASGAADHQRPLFTLMMLELWHRLWIDPPRGEGLAGGETGGQRRPRPARVGRAAGLSR